MAMGGSMTLTTQASTRYTPSTRAPWSQAGAWRYVNRSLSRSCTQNRPSASSWEGTLAPLMVIQNTAASSSSMTGMPVARLVSRRSRRRSRLP